MLQLDLLRMKKALEGLAEPVELRIHPSPHRTVLNEQFLEAAHQIQQATSGAIRAVERKPEADEHLPALPAMSLYWRGRQNIHYLAIPQGPEAIPFIEAVVALPRGAAGHTERWVKLLAGKRTKAHLYVFVHPGCTNCPAAVRASLKLALISHEIHASIIDVERFGDLARRYKIRSVPTTVLDGGWTHTGTVRPERLVELVAGSRTESIRQQVFDSMVEAGRLEDAAEWIVENGSVYFAKAWARAGLQKRMALMLIAERTLMRNQHAMADAVPQLAGLLEAADSPARGDTADLLGMIGDERAVEVLEKLAEDPDREVAMVARDVLKNLTGR